MASSKKTCSGDGDQSLLTSEAQVQGMAHLPAEYTNMAQQGRVTPLVQALWNGDYEATMKILGELKGEDLKARLEKRETKLNITALFHVVLGSNYFAKLNLAFQLCMPSLMQNHKKILEVLIELGANVNVKDIFGMSPLFMAHDLDMAKSLLEAGADPNCRNRLGQLNLFMSINRHELDMANLLLQYGADPDLKTSGVQGSHSSRELAVQERIKDKMMGKQTKASKDLEETLEGGLKGKVCKTFGCKNPAALKCPKCKTLGIHGSFFCSQACFNSSWALHKQVHKKARREKEGAEEAQVQKMLAELGLNV